MKAPDNPHTTTNPTPPLSEGAGGRIELRSNEVQEILSRPPRKLIRYGTSVICGVLALLIAGSFFFNYPDIISGDVIITTEDIKKLTDTINDEQWQQNQHLNAGDTVLERVPDHSGDLIAKVQIPVGGSGKVVPGQKVNIKVVDYPYLEYGMIVGTTKNISMHTNNKYYIVEVSIDQNLITTNKKELRFMGELTGTADIITENRTLIQRIFPPIKYFFTNSQ